MRLAPLVESTSHVSLNLDALCANVGLAKVLLALDVLVGDGDMDELEKCLRGAGVGAGSGRVMMREGLSVAASKRKLPSSSVHTIFESINHLRVLL